MYEEIYLEEEGGELSGYTVSFKDENYKNFLEETLSNSSDLFKIIQFIEHNKFSNIVIIKNLNVEEEFRGKGIGKSLLEEASSQGDIVLLISDRYESQIKGFLLDKFYESADFLKITDTSTGFLMCYPAEVANNLIKDMLKQNHNLKIKIKP